MKLTSSAFNQNESIPAIYTCDGYNIAPPLEIHDVPVNTKSLVLIVDDPDAPRGTWIHWIVWNIDPETTLIEENVVPIGAVEGTTSFGKPGYGGPCPPSGAHRYFFKMYALNAILDLLEGASVEELVSVMKNHVVAETQLMGVYERK